MTASERIDRLPTGRVTFLFSDIEGSTRLVERFGDRYPELLSAHDQLVVEAIEGSGGIPLGTEGDSHFAVFVQAEDAATAALQIQQGLAGATWPEDCIVRDRIGLHTGDGVLGGANYVGIDVHRAARIADAGHGGQTLTSEATALAVEKSLDPDARLIDLGKHRLKDLSDPLAIFELWAPGLQREFDALRTLDSIPHNLPIQLSSFVGRDELLSEALRLLEKSRLLTLTGTGGTGKTRLSLQVAAEASASFSDGVFFVGLSPLTDSDLVPSAITAALGAQPAGASMTPEEHLLAQLAGRSVLLVLDNFEHLLAARGLVTVILQHAPRARVLITSRAPLRVSGEQELPVPPLDVVPEELIGAGPDALAEIEAVSLFVERAKSVRPDFELTLENEEAVIGLVNHLDGLPLAIELVASRIRIMRVQDIFERLDPSLLSSGSVDLPERQRTIETAIGWSYELLPPPARRLFEWLAVFAGGARIDEIEEVARGAEIPDLLSALETLIDHSLLTSGNGVTGPRFRMLHVIREFARDRLDTSGDGAAARRAHLVAYVEYVEGAATKLLGGERGKWLDALEEDHDNIRAALDWGTGMEVDLSLRLAAATWRFWQARGHLQEAAMRIGRVLAQAGGSPVARLKAVEALGGIQWWQGDIDSCLATYRSLLDMSRELGDDREIANALFNYALGLSFSTGRFDDAVPLLDEGEEIYRGLGDLNGLGDIYWARGDGAMLMGDAEYTIESMTEAASYYSRSGNEFGRGWAEYNIAAAMVRSGRVVEAWPHLVTGLTLFASHRDLSAITLFLALAVQVAAYEGDRHRALTLAGALHALRLSTGTDLVTVEFNAVAGFEYETLESLEGEEAEFYAVGKRLSPDQAVDYVLGWSPGQGD